MNLTNTWSNLLERKLLSRCAPLGPDVRAALVVAPHPDDETLGCGGTVALLRSRGVPVHVTALSDGSGSHAHLVDREVLPPVRRAELIRATTRLGVRRDDVSWGAFRDGDLSHRRSDVAAFVAQRVAETDASHIFAPLPVSEHPDHVAAHDAVIDAVERVGRPITVLRYPVWFWRHWPWVPFVDRGRALWKATARGWAGVRAVRLFDTVVDIQAVRGVKLSALDEHASQVTRLLPTPQWTTLHDVSGGKLVARLTAGHEFFRVTSLRGR